MKAKPSPGALLAILIVLFFIVVSRRGEPYREPPVPIPAKAPPGPKGPSRIDLHFAATEAVRARLKSPSSAEFPGVLACPVTALESGDFAVLGYVDAQNSFGAQIRNHWRVVLSGNADNLRIVSVDLQ